MLDQILVTLKISEVLGDSLSLVNFNKYGLSRTLI